MNSQILNRHVLLQILHFDHCFSYFSFWLIWKKKFTTKKFDLKISDILKSRIVLEISKIVFENLKLSKGWEMQRVFMCWSLQKAMEVSRDI